MNYFEKMMIVEQIKNPMFQPINLRNKKVKEKHNTLINNLLSTPNWRRYGSKKQYPELTHKKQQ